MPIRRLLGAVHSEEALGEAFNKAKKGAQTAMPLLKKDNRQQCETAEETNALLLKSKFPPPLSATPPDTTRYTGPPGPLTKSQWKR